MSRWRFRPIEAPEPLPVEDVVIPMSDMVTIMELRESMCRWPRRRSHDAGIPLLRIEDADGGPYCNHHARIAYQPAQDRRRERDRERRLQRLA